MKLQFTIEYAYCGYYRLHRSTEEQELTKQLFSAFSEPIRIGHMTSLDRRGKTTLNKEEKNLVFGAAAVYGIEIDTQLEDDCDGA